MIVRMLLCCTSLILTAGSATAAHPSREEAEAALKKAVQFYHRTVGSHGGYVYKYSPDLKYRQGEGIANENIAWVQPPGTPAVGLAFLQAYEATGDREALDAAKKVAGALVKGQLQSGGWYYSIMFDPKDRRQHYYRKPPHKGIVRISIDENSPGGWDEWRKRRNKGNITTMDDDTTQTALQFLMRIDEVLKFEDKEIHEAAEYALRSLIMAQYPIGAWSHNFDSFGPRRPSEKHYPAKPASYPETWSRTWTKKYAGCYEINDEITPDAIVTMLEAHRIYGRKEYLEAAKRGGDFLIAAQMPDPQPAWAQQYDRHVQPVWSRKFEPPAITGGESQTCLQTLLLLYERTDEKRFLEPVPKALAYLKSCRLKDGRLARYYELKTNKPLYFTRKYQLTYKPNDLPTHYGFIVSSKLDRISKRYQQLKEHGPNATAKPTSAARTREQLAGRVRAIIKAMDKRGAWTEPGFVRDSKGRKVIPGEGIINSATFNQNVEILSRYITASK